MMIECPFCDGQGIVCRAEVKKIALTIYICDECDTVWLDGRTIKEESCQPFDEFMNHRGLQTLWSELVRIDRIWRK
ncbi:hypothetical protein SAMN05192533_11218 [Mesobacillus persicus]|uniref:Transcription factor zinc-finger domain-containing protein n=1 Tax=Mesobacillus persicus TaxID=930146 RepID=A0A1H8G069_9BACI|nr:hypothetical protein [Mesobacillus persicus]SEN36897.1 hypothetical protein SAMN05192533_11218 [Mesobacillus persicus]